MKRKFFMPMILAGLVLFGSVADIYGAGRTSRSKTKTTKQSFDASSKKVAITEASHTNSAEVSYSWRAYPDTAKTPAEAQLLVEREVPKTVRPNQSYTYTLKVSNQSYFKVDDVTITERLPEGFQLIKATPAPATRGKDLKWDLGIMAPEQTEVIIITGKASKPGKLYHSGSAKANFNLNRMVAIMEVIEAALHVKATAPEEVIIGQTFPVKLDVNNVGSATVLGASMDHMLPNNMMTQAGEKKISANLGDIKPGQIKTINLKLKATKTGKYSNNFIVKAKDGVTANANVVTFVRKPRLKLVAKAPRMRFVGNVISYNLNITNLGDGNANQMLTKLHLGSGTSFLTANEGGKLENGTVVWRTSSLQPNESKALTVRAKANKIMKVRALAETVAVAAEPVKITLDTNVEGIAALLLKVDDINDPVPVGETETYIVRVTNQGSLPATNIRISCDLESSMEFVKSTGPTKAQVASGGEGKGGAILLKKAAKLSKAMPKGRIIVFDTLGSLAPKQEAKWQIVIKALKEGDFRFNVNVISDQLTRPVHENESTTFYND